MNCFRLIFWTMQSKQKISISNFNKSRSTSSMIGYENDEMIWIQLDPFSFNLFWKLRHNGKLLNLKPFSSLLFVICNYDADAGRKIVQIVGKWALLIYYKKNYVWFSMSFPLRKSVINGLNERDVTFNAAKKMVNVVIEDVFIVKLIR